MPDPSTYRPAPGTIPTGPGVYRFSDPSGRVIYVGKAKNLRSRVLSYFQDVYNLHPRTAQMVTTAAKVDWTIVASEVEALQLEYSWIKEFDPRFNVKYRDDKSYPSLAVTMNEQFPRLQVMRGPKRKGVRYFGPYSHAWAIRETLDLLLRVFPARTCSAGVFKRSQQVGRPCLLGYIDKCSAPCVGRVSPEEHRAIVEDFCDFMAGQTRPYVRRLEKEMEKAAARLDFERAARLRDDVGALNRALEKQTVVLGDGTDADVVAFAQDELEAAVQVFYVRGGRIRGQRGWVVDKVEIAETSELVEQFLTTAYLDEANEIPREVLVPELPPDADVVAELLTELRGAKVDLRVPQRGDKRALADTVRQNAEQSFRLHKLKRAGDLTARSRALQELQDALDLEQAPLRIECYDVSHIQGTDVVASMVVFEDGLPRRSEYRRFAVRGAPDGTVPDDTRSMNQVLTRRFARYLAESGGGAAPAPTDDADGLTELPLGRSGVTQQNTPQGGPVDPETGRARKFAYPPQLVVVDGGAPQVAAAAQALAELGIPTHGDGAVALVGLAKRLEEVWLPDEADPVIMPRTSEGLYLLQRLRDEAHRFAIAYHRQKRSTSMTRSELDAVPGLGPVRKKALMARFGSVRKLRAATLDEVAEVTGIGPATAAAVLRALGAEGAGPGLAFDPVTGEVLEDPPAATSPSSAANTLGADR